jgi:hypothetical protein
MVIMKRLDPEKLFVEFTQDATETDPILGRKYTLTHSDQTAELFLTIGLEYAYEKITSMRDEVLAEWRSVNDCMILVVYVFVGGEDNPNIAEVRNAIFRRELPLALEAIRYGDNKFFSAHKELDKAPILINFESPDINYNYLENWGTPEDYK